MVKIYYDKDADLKVLKKKTIAVIVMEARRRTGTEPA